MRVALWQHVSNTGMQLPALIVGHCFNRELSCEATLLPPFFPLTGMRRDDRVGVGDWLGAVSRSSHTGDRCWTPVSHTGVEHRCRGVTRALMPSHCPTLPIPSLPYHTTPLPYLPIPHHTPCITPLTNLTIPSLTIHPYPAMPYHTSILNHAPHLHCPNSPLPSVTGVPIPPSPVPSPSPSPSLYIFCNYLSFRFLNYDFFLSLLLSC